MAKIVIGKRPKNFSHVVTVPMIEGGFGSVEVTYTYRTRTEFGAFVDDLVNAAGTQPPVSQSSEDVAFSLEQALEKTKDKNADYIMKIVEGWNLDQDFTRANVAQLCDELPGAALKIINDYRELITEGKRGN